MNRELRRPPAAYDEDFCRWSHEQAQLLRDGHFDALDRANIAEELDTLGRSEAAALRSSLRLIILHLLKLTHQPERATRSWRSTIVRERNNAERRLAENPSLKASLPKLFAEAYEDGRREAIAETGLGAAVFPEDPEITVEQVWDRRFCPWAEPQEWPVEPVNTRAPPDPPSSGKHGGHAEFEAGVC